jgi:hypothetical protein
MTNDQRVESVVAHFDRPCWTHSEALETAMRDKVIDLLRAQQAEIERLRVELDEGRQRESGAEVADKTVRWDVRYTPEEASAMKDTLIHELRTRAKQAEAEVERLKHDLMAANLSRSLVRADNEAMRAAMVEAVRRADSYDHDYSPRGAQAAKFVATPLAPFTQPSIVWTENGLEERPSTGE